jgi:hypothetical protein
LTGISNPLRSEYVLEVDAYDPVSNTWSVAANMTSGRRLALVEAAPSLGMQRFLPLTG